MGAKDGRAPYTRPSDDDQSLEDSLSEEADYYPDVKESALGSIDYNPVSYSFLPSCMCASASWSERSFRSTSRAWAVGSRAPIAVNGVYPIRVCVFLCAGTKGGTPRNAWVGPSDAKKLGSALPGCCTSVQTLEGQLTIEPWYMTFQGSVPTVLGHFAWQTTSETKVLTAWRSWSASETGLHLLRRCQDTRGRSVVVARMGRALAVLFGWWRLWRCTTTGQWSPT